MPLLALWKSNPEAISSLVIEQVVSNAGNGELKDGSLCSTELREYFSLVETKQIAAYVDQCLAAPITNGGRVLQDLVNELGRRLEYKVTHGRYSGTVNAVGFDGVWESPEGHAIVVEVKTTDVYRISLETIAKYRTSLLAQGAITPASSILIIVGREDTGDLEAQVRGSRHAWDVRLMSVESLAKLVVVKEGTGDKETAARIRSLLVPFEYTKLDDIIEVVFTTAQDVDAAEQHEAEEADDSQKEDAQNSDKALINARRVQMLEAFARRFKVTLLKRSRAQYWDASGKTRVACTVSKRYQAQSGMSALYWYAYHAAWDQFLGEADQGYLAFGGLDLDVGVFMPLPLFRSVLSKLNVTKRSEGKMYWHVKIVQSNSGGYAMMLPDTSELLDLAPYVVPIVKEP